jgi:nucleotide-binding universal stress UspA family protein
MGTIVVGVDGSEGSIEALRFAAAEARLRGDRVRAVWAWHVHPLAYEGVYTAPGLNRQVFAEAAEADLQAFVQETGELGVEFEAETVEGNPVSVLVGESDKADLLVVGSRGLGGFRRLLLGSVGQGCVQHSRCPTIVVPNGVPPDADLHEAESEAPSASDCERRARRHDP